MSTFEELEREGKGNCLTISAMLCSASIRLGWSRSCVLVSGGGLLSHTLTVTSLDASSVTVHAWAVLVPPKYEGWIVNPVFMQLERLGDFHAFESRLRLASPVDKLFPVVINNQTVKPFVSIYKAYTHLISLWTP